jgi:hypothetical protein
MTELVTVWPAMEPVRYPGLVGTRYDVLPPPPPAPLPVRPAPPWSLQQRVALLFGVLALIGVLAGWAGWILSGWVTQWVGGG